MQCSLPIREIEWMPKKPAMNTYVPEFIFFQHILLIFSYSIKYLWVLCPKILIFLILHNCVLSNWWSLVNHLQIFICILLTLNILGLLAASKCYIVIWLFKCLLLMSQVIICNLIFQLVLFSKKVKLLSSKEIIWPYF